MNEIFLLKLGEVVLKGLNRFSFENKLKSNIARRMRPYGSFNVHIAQSTIYVEPQNDDCDVDGAWDACHTILVFLINDYILSSAVRLSSKIAAVIKVRIILLIIIAYP